MCVVVIKEKRYGEVADAIKKVSMQEAPRHIITSFNSLSKKVEKKKRNAREKRQSQRFLFVGRGEEEEEKIPLCRA